jgi:RNA polymerase sigma factor (sigma-70 family)
MLCYSYRGISMNDPETHPSLILRLQNPDDEQAWGEFLSVYEPFLKQMILRRGLQEADARDLTQQILARLARSVSQWQPDGRPASFRRWLFTVARNAALNFLSQRRREPQARGGTEFLDLLERQPAPSGREQDELDRQYRQEVFLWAVEQVRGEFRESSWQAFWQTLIERRPVAEVAAELGVSPGAIYMSRSRIIARLKAKVQEFEIDCSLDVE